MMNRNHPRIDDLTAIIRAAEAEWIGSAWPEPPVGCSKCGGTTPVKSQQTMLETDVYRLVFISKLKTRTVNVCADCHPEIPDLVAELSARIKSQLERNELAGRWREYLNQIRKEFQTISPRFRACRFRTYYPREESQAFAVDQLTKWLASATAQEQHPFCILFGNYGVGKTHLLRAAQRRIAYRSCVPTFVNDVELNTAWKKAHDRKAARGPDEIIAEVKAARFLLIDDIGKSKPTEGWLRTLYEVINWRYENLLPTLISTNAEPANMATVVGPASADRLLDVNNIILHVGGISVRSAA